MVPSVGVGGLRAVLCGSVIFEFGAAWGQQIPSESAIPDAALEKHGLTSGKLAADAELRTDATLFGLGGHPLVLLESRFFEGRVAAALECGKTQESTIMYI